MGSAPKNGTEILADVRGDVRVVWWYEPEKDSVLTEAMKFLRLAEPKGCWHSDGSTELTHLRCWMPLPVPPERTP